MTTPLYLAQASARAYDPKLVSLAMGGVEIVIEEYGDELIVANQGTTFDFGDIWNDMRGIPTKHPDLGWCHSGFLKPTLEMWPTLRASLLGASKIHFTGHSKGGGEAHVQASLTVLDPDLPECTLTTFGSPKVGFGKLRRVLKTIPVDLVVNGWDAVAEHSWFYPHVRKIRRIGEGLDRHFDHKLAEYIKYLTAIENGVELPSQREPAVGQEIED